MKKFIILFLLASNIIAQNEFLVNSGMDSTQRAPVIAKDNNGNYAIVWQSMNQASSNSGYDIYCQFFGNTDQKVLDEFRVNDNIEGEQHQPSAAMFSNGDLAVVYSSYENPESIYDIRVKIVHSPASSIPPIAEFIANTTTINSQSKPDVDIDAEDNFVITWESWYQDGSYKGVYARKFNKEGIPLSAEFQINTTILNSQCGSSVKFLGNGNFVVVWESWKQDVATPSGYGLYGKIFDKDCNLLIDEFPINTYTNDYQWLGDITKLNSGGFVVVWCSWEQDGDDGGIYIQKFDDNGIKSASEKLVNKTTVNYQWLPKVNEMPDGKIGVVWSSWLQDGSREGVYAKLLNADLSEAAFETQVNEYTDSYQWEPDFIPTATDEMMVTWASWGQYNNDYEVIARRVKLTGPQGVIGSKFYEHNSGTTTSRFYVHVMDSTQLTGDKYELSFNVSDTKNILVNIINTSTSKLVVEKFPINKGEGIFYLTQEFDGVTVEIQPNYTFDLDYSLSYNVNNSGSNLSFNIGKGFGQSVLAPIDIALIWGSTEKGTDGLYLYPLESAYGSSGQKVVKCPFYAWNITDGEKMELVVLESASNANQQWDANENIGILTPNKYTTLFPRYHASLQVIAPSGGVLLPGVGDTNYVFTKRPIKSDDTFTFETKKAYITTDAASAILNPDKFSLEQNYPNPFNPTTTIKYNIPDLKSGNHNSESVSLIVFDVLGRQVASLVNQKQKPGSYKILFDAGRFASGIYFYNLRCGNISLSRKMILMK